MADYTLKSFDEMEALFGGGMLKARASLGASSFGMQILNLPPNADQYPNHDHAESGQEEVYLVLAGSADFDIDGEQVSVGPEQALRVGPSSKRKITTGADGARVLAIGGVPGAAYDAPPFTELGAEPPTPPGQ